MCLASSCLVHYKCIVCSLFCSCFLYTSRYFLPSFLPSFRHFVSLSFFPSLCRSAFISFCLLPSFSLSLSICSCLAFCTYFLYALSLFNQLFPSICLLVLHDCRCFPLCCAHYVFMLFRLVAKSSFPIFFLYACRSLLICFLRVFCMYFTMSCVLAIFLIFCMYIVSLHLVVSYLLIYSCMCLQFFRSLFRHGFCYVQCVHSHTYSFCDWFFRCVCMCLQKCVFISVRLACCLYVCLSLLFAYYAFPQFMHVMCRSYFYQYIQLCIYLCLYVVLSLRLYPFPSFLIDSCCSVFLSVRLSFCYNVCGSSIISVVCFFFYVCVSFFIYVTIICQY